MALTDAQEEYLNNFYYDSERPGSFSGPEKFYQAVKEDGRYYLSLFKIRKWLQNQEVYTTNRLVHRHFNRNEVEVAGLDDVWDSDLLDFTNYSMVNNGYNYILICIDIFSRYVWARPLKTKTGREVSEEMSSILLDGNRKPNALRSDRGSEYLNETMKRFFKRNNIHHYTTHNQLQANYAERVICTIKSRPMRLMSKKMVKRWVDDLQAIITSYNSTIHSSLNAKPEDIKSDVVNKSRLEQYLLKQKRLNPEHPRKKKPGPIFDEKPYKFKIGQSVRMRVTRSKMDRLYDEFWTPEIFTVSKRRRRNGLNIYSVDDKLDEPIKGTFYENELQKVAYDPNGVYRIEKIIRRRQEKGIDESLVKWYGWPKKFNSWMPDDILINFRLAEELQEYTPHRGRRSTKK